MRLIDLFDIINELYNTQEDEVSLINRISSRNITIENSGGINYFDRFLEMMGRLK